MSKKSCLNILLSFSTADPISLASLTPFSQFCKDQHVKLSSEIQGTSHLALENQAIQAEPSHSFEAFSLWFKSISLKLKSYKSLGERVTQK
jgi:hypothetical protein